jgi:hypothetical protein
VTAVLALDVDGVLNATSRGSRALVVVRIRPEWVTTFTNPEVIDKDVELHIDRDRDGRFLAAVESLGVQIVWCTTWEDAANEAIGPLYGLGTLDVLPISDFETASGSPVDAKVAAIDAVFADRPVLWIDDDSWRVKHVWAGRTDRKMMAPAAHHGLRTADREHALRWLLRVTGRDPVGARGLLRG